MEGTAAEFRTNYRSLPEREREGRGLKREMVIVFVRGSGELSG